MRLLQIFVVFSLTIPATISGQAGGTHSKHIASLILGKSVFSTPDYGLSISNTYAWIPDAEIEVTFSTIKIELAYSRYDAFYKIKYLPEDVEKRKYNLFDLLYKKQWLINDRKITPSFGVGLSLRDLNELIIVDVVKHVSTNNNCWYDILSEPRRSFSVGVVLGIDCKYAFSDRLFLKGSASYNIYMNSYDMFRIGLGIGFSFVRN